MAYANGSYGAQAYAAVETTYSSEVLADAPWGYWRLTEAPGASAWKDSSANGRTLSTSGTTLVTGPTGSGATFANGGEAHSDAAATRPYVGTWEVWLRCSAPGGVETPLMGFSPFSGGNGIAPRLGLLPSGKPQFEVYGPDFVDYLISSPTSVTDGQWHHVVGSVGSAGMKLYVDGALVASNAARTQGANLGDSPVFMLHRGNFMNNATPLDLAEPAFYALQLSDTRVAAHYAAAGVATNSATTGTVTGTVSSLTAAISGTATPPPVTGTVTGAVSSPTAALAGAVAPPGGVAGSIAGTVASPAATLTGTVAPPPARSGTITGTVSSPAAALAGTVAPPATAVSYSTEVLADAPLVYYRLGEAAPTPATDSSGNNRPPVMGGATSVSPIIPGDTGYAITPSPSGPAAASIAFSAAPGLTGGTVSAELWFLMPAAGTSVKGPLVSFGTQNTDGWGIGIGGSTYDVVGTTLVMLYENVNWVPTGVTIAPGLHHLVVTRGTTNNFIIYLDGNQVYTTSVNTPRTPTGSIWFGGSSSSTTRGLSSAVAIDRFAVFTSVLAAARVTAHYASGSGSHTAVLADTPSLYWRFEENVTFPPLTDSSGNGRNGSFVGIPTFAVTGLLNGGTDKALQVASGSGGITPYDVTWMRPTTHSVEALFKASSVTGTQTIVARHGNSGSSWIIRLEGNLLKYWVNVSGWATITATTLITVGTTYHVVGTHDGTTMRLYVNGVLEASGGFAAPLNDNSAPITIGASGLGESYTGVIDEVAFYGSALNAGRVAVHASRALGGVSPWAITLKGLSPTLWYKHDDPLDGNNQTTPQDSSGNNLHSTQWIMGTAFNESLIPGDATGRARRQSANWPVTPSDSRLFASTGSLVFTVRATGYGYEYLAYRTDSGIRLEVSKQTATVGLLMVNGRSTGIRASDLTATNTPHWYLITWTPTSIKLYIDGDLAFSDTTVTIPVAPAGTWWEFPMGYGEVYIDDTAILPAALSATQVKSLDAAWSAGALGRALELDTARPFGVATFYSGGTQPAAFIARNRAAGAGGTNLPAHTGTAVGQQQILIIATHASVTPTTPPGWTAMSYYTTVHSRVSFFTRTLIATNLNATVSIAWSDWGAAEMRTYLANDFTILGQGTGLVAPSRDVPVGSILLRVEASAQPNTFGQGTKTLTPDAALVNSSGAQTYSWYEGLIAGDDPVSNGTAPARTATLAGGSENYPQYVGILVNGVAPVTTVVSSDTRPYKLEVLNDGPLVYWPDGTKDVVGNKDLSGNSYDLVLNGGPTQVPGAAVNGPGFLFGSTVNDYAQTVTDLQMPLAAYTVEAWVYLPAAPGGINYTTIVGQGANSTGSGATEFGIMVDPTGKPAVYLYNGATQLLVGPNPLSFGAWHHVVATLGSAGMALRVDKTTVASNTQKPDANLSRKIWLHGGGYNNQGLTMRIAEPAVYNKVLSNARIDAHYNSAWTGIIQLLLEKDSGRYIPPAIGVTINTAVETDVALTDRPTDTRAFFKASTVDQAQSLTVFQQTVLVPYATAAEEDLAQKLGQVIYVQTAVENDIARPVVGRNTVFVPFGMAVETDLIVEEAIDATISQIILVGQVVEDDDAILMFGRNRELIQVLGRAVDTEIAWPVSSTAIYVPFGQASETASPLRYLLRQGYISSNDPVEHDGAGQSVTISGGIGMAEAKTDLVLEIVDKSVDQAPTSVVVVVTNGVPEEVLTFRIDGRVVYTAPTDTMGNLWLTSIPVEEVHGSKGEHVLSVSQERMGGDSQIFRVQRWPNLLPTVQGPDLDPVKVPGSVRPSGVRSWVLQDLMPGGLGSYILPLNPTDADNPAFERALSAVHTTSLEGMFHVYESGRQPLDFSFSGYCPTQDMHDRLQAYGELKRRFYLIDHRGRAWIVIFSKVELTPRLRQTDIYGNPSDWVHDYVVTATIYNQEAPVLM